jgi:hypothetical protein
MSLLSAKNMNKIKKIQKKAIRIMSNSTYYAHTNPIFAQHQILPYDLLIKQSQLSLMHSIHNKLAPASFRNIWQTNAERAPDLNLRNAIVTITLSNLGLNSLKNLLYMLSPMNGTIFLHSLSFILIKIPLNGLLKPICLKC